MLSSRSLRLQQGFRILHNGKGRPPISQSQARLYSQLLATTRPSSQPFSKPTPHLPHRIRSPSPLLLQLQRHASTNTSSQWDVLIDEASSQNAANLEPHVGWLKEMGLDYGWGPTSMMQTILERVDLLTGLPWWATIMCVTVGLRVLILPLQVRASDVAARLGHLAPYTGPLQQKSRECMMAGDKVGSAAATRESQAIMAAAGLGPGALFGIVLPILIQGPLGFGLFRLMRGMAYMPVPGLSDGGVLWFTDLTVSDPLHVLPLMAGWMMWYVVKRGGENGSSNLSPGMKRFMLYGFPGATTLIFWGLPASMQLLAFSSSAWSLLQTSALRWPTFRKWVGIAMLPPPKDPAKTTSPYKGTANAYRTPDEIAKSHTVAARWNAMRKPVTDYMKKNNQKKSTTRLSARDLDKAKQYEKERRAEIDAARERFINEQQRGNGKQ